jgi:Holliday junction resolvase RusA-like endonuclease
MLLTIKGKVPSKKNSRKLFVRNNRIVNIPSQNYKDWHDIAVVELQSQFKGYKITDYPIDLNIVVYYGDNRRHDLDNSLGSIMDTLTDAQIIEDDDVLHVSQLTIQYGGVDKLNPRCEIYIED